MSDPSELYRLWPKCRHAQNQDVHDLSCRLPAGCLFCPCLGKAHDADGKQTPVARLSVDAGGQIVWCALGSSGEPRAWYTVIATTEPGGRGEVVLFVEKEDLQAAPDEKGVGFKLTSRHHGPRFVSLAELMEKAILGEEYVHVR